MNSISELDSAIYLILGTSKLKVARVIAQVNREKDIPHEVVAMRLRSLIELNKLEGFGNLDNWRSSEVRVMRK
jgi:hypothetical protein